MNPNPIHLAFSGKDFDDDLEEAETRLQRIIQGPYSSDCDENGVVCYQIYDTPIHSIEEWIATSKRAGLVFRAEILDW